MRRRRFSGRRRGRGSKFRHRKSRFTKRVQRAELSNEQVHRLVATNTGLNLAAGDGTSAQLVIFSPLTQLTQGAGLSNFRGNVIFPRGVRIRGQASNAASPGFQQFFVRWTLFWSKASASYPSAGQVFASTTTANTNPTQTSPRVNPTIFDSANPFVSNGFVSPFDVTKIKVIRSKIWSINKVGAGPGTSIFDTFLRFPKNKRITFEDTQESPLSSAPNFPEYGNYYLIYQVYGPPNTGTISTTVLGTMDITLTTYFKDL